nr:reverse transcriptase domain-containing protein [Tanacetum cinerariifolium]
MLGEDNITYRPRTSIKGQILADFLNEIPSNASQGASVAETQKEPWTLFTDGSSCVDGSGAGLILTNPDGVEFTYALRPLSGRAGESQVLDRCNGLLHEVDRSKSCGNDYRRTNNGKQFADNPFKDWCDKLNITQHFASVKHPQSNGLVERANRSLGEGIKARPGEGNKNWVEELPHVLWAHRTMVKSSHGDTPFSLTYETEAVIPAEIGMPTYRTTAVDVVNNDEELRLNLELLEERRELAAINKARSKSKMTKYYNARVRDIAFKPGDFVYRSNDASHAVDGGKLGPK